MGDFDLIQAGFNNADETINFGTRIVGGATTSLFEICTLGLFKSEDEFFTGVRDISINATIKNGYLFFAIDKSLKIFEDIEMSNLVFSASFEYIISNMAVSSNGQFFVVCFETGSFHLFSINELVIEKIHSGCPSDSPPQNVHIVECYEDEELAGFLIVYQSGLISRLTVRTSINESKFDVTADILGDLESRIKLSDFCYPLLITGGYEIKIFNIESKEAIAEEYNHFKKMFHLEHMILCLDHEGNIMRLSPLTLMIFSIDYDYLIEDILVLNTENPQILIVTKPNETGEFFLQLVEINFNRIFSLKINYPIEFVHMDFTKNDIVFISKVTNDDRITELRLQSVYETDPESRLMRLIKRMRFEEAELFAKTFNVDPSIILKAKAQLIVDKTKCTTEDINELIKLMDDIADASFNLQCCADIDCSNFEDVRKILTYGSKISPKIDDENREKLLWMKMANLDLLYKFDTFMALSNKGGIESWINFSMCNLLLEVKEYLRNYQIQDAIIVYNRLDHKAISSLNEDHIEDILKIFNNLPYDLFQQFLPTFIPITMTHLPSALILLVNWLLNKIYQLEKRDSVNFPENGIAMVEDIVKLIRVQKKNCISFQRHCIANRGFEDLSAIVDGLKILKILKNKFAICVKLDEYLQGPMVLTSTLVQLSMPPEQYEYFLKNFLYNYMLQNDIEPDTVFVKEIMTLLEYGENWITCIEVILAHVNSIETKLRIVKDILEKAPVPWCDVTRRIAVSVLHLKHPLVKEIEDTLKDEPRLIVLRNAKYGIKKRQIVEEFGRVIHRIIYVNRSNVRHMIEDVYHLCKSDAEKFEANDILMQHLIMKGHLDEARSLFGKFGNKEAYECASRMVLSAAYYINDQNFSDHTVKENFYDMLPKLYDILIDLCDMDHEKELHQQRFKIFRGIYYINNEFKSQFTSNDFLSSFNRREKYRELLEIVSEKITSERDKFPEVLRYAEKIAYHLTKNKQEVLIDLCEQLKNFEFVLKAGEYLYEIDADTKSICLVCGLFMKFLGRRGFDAFEQLSLGGDVYDQTLATFEDVNGEDDSTRNDIFVNGLIVAHKLVTKARVKADPSEVLKVNETGNWINTCYYLVKKDNSTHDQLFKNVYCPKWSVPSSGILDTIRGCYEAFVQTLDKNNFDSCEYLTYFADASEPTLAPLIYEINNLPSKIDLFYREGHCLTAMILLKTLWNSLHLHPIKDKTVLKPLQTLITKKLPGQMMYAVVSANHIDLDLLYTLLLSVRKDAMKYLSHYLQTFKRNCKKLHDLSLVGIRLLDFYKETKGRDIMLNSIKCCKWWRALTAFHSKMIYDEFFKFDAETRLKYLINLEIVGTKNIRKYCDDFGLSVDLYFKEYLRSCLMNWKPDYEIELVNGKRKLLIKNDADQLHTKCQDIIDEIEEKYKPGMCESMEKILKEINFYHYEVFLTIYKTLENNLGVSNTKYIDMLLFLKNYTRFERPGQREKEEWYITFPDTQLLDPLSEFRLPYTTILFSADVWSILRPEMNLKSYEIWFHATTILRKNLKIDDICAYAVKEVVSSGILGTNVPNTWNLYPKFEDLFVEVDRCVRHISDLERAAATVYHLMNYTPDGADKVIAAELSYKYTTAYRNNNLKDAHIERTFVKAKNKFFGLSVCRILHRFNLAKEKYLKLVTQPQSLIESLYMDESIPKLAGTFSFNFSDINNAVDAIAELFDLNVEEIRLELLNRWLSSAHAGTDLDSTLCFVPVPPSVSHTVNEQNNEEDNLKRAVYLCSSGNQQYWRTHLLSVGYNEVEDDHANVAFRARALKCFCAFTDESTITKLTKDSYKEFLNYIDKLTLLSELECLSIFLNVETLDQSNKRELLKKLSGIGRPLAIKCMGAVCITYFIEEHKYWEYIVNKAIKLEMIEELKIYVEFLKDKCDRYFYVRAWQALVDKSFQRVVNLPDDGRLDEVLVENFLMIQSCPVSFSLNYEKIMQECIVLKKNEYAVVLLQYMPQENRQSYEKDIVGDDNLIVNLEKLKKKGVWGSRNLESQLNLSSM